MGWINSDDMLMPNSLFVVAEIFTQFPEIDWITGTATTIDSDSRYVRSRNYRVNLYDYLIGDWPVIQQESTFWRRRLWESVGSGLNEELSIAFDSDLWAKFFLHADHYHVDCPIGAYRKVSNSTSIRKSEEFSKVTERSIVDLRNNISKKLLRKSFRYRIFKWLICMISSTRFQNLLGRFFGDNRFAYHCLSYMSVESQWRKYSQWK